MSGEITPDKFPLAWYDRALDYVRSVDCKRLATRGGSISPTLSSAIVDPLTF
jgi:hypothetical protein